MRVTNGCQSKDPTHFNLAAYEINACVFVFHNRGKSGLLFFFSFFLSFLPTLAKTNFLGRALVGIRLDF